MLITGKIAKLLSGKENKMPPPVIQHCGLVGEPACPAQPCVSSAEVLAYGTEQYLKGREDALKGVPVSERIKSKVTTRP